MAERSRPRGRKLRIEEKCGLYRVVNRGNYRQWVFRSEGAKVGFEKGMFEACKRSRGVVHVWEPDQRRPALWFVVSAPSVTHSCDLVGRMRDFRGKA